jgi:hypothetical protein
VRSSAWAASQPRLGNLLIAWMLLRSTVIGARIGGIEWRGVRYPSAALSAGRRVRFCSVCSRRSTNR